MRFTLSCPYCGATSEVEEEWAGRVCECPRCRQSFMIPAPGGTPPQQQQQQPGYRRSTPPPPVHHWNPPPQPPPQIYCPPAYREPVAEEGGALVYNPTGTIVWSCFCPVLAFWFLNRSYDELDNDAKRGGCMICFFIGIGHFVIAFVSCFANSPVLNTITQFGGLAMFIGALIESCKFASALKRDYCDRDIRYQSTWPAGLVMIAIYIITIIIIVAASVR